MVLVTNHGRYTFTRVEAQFSPDGRSITPASDTEPMRVAREADRLRTDVTGSIGDAYRGVLQPGAAMRRQSGAFRVDRSRPIARPRR